MLIEINLLPRKGEKRGSVSLLFVIIPVATLLIGGGLFSYTYISTGKSLATTKQALTTAQAQVQAQQQQIKKLESSSSANQLKQMIDWAKTNQVSTVKVLATLTALLPEDGYFVNYQFNSGAVNISIQFTTINDAANYLYQLQNSSSVQSVQMSNITTKVTAKVNSQNTENVDPDEKILPRYLSQYQIKLNLDKVKKASEDTVK
jgi:type IV pilus assembly protein PilN